jgi:hypothetical protein
MRKLLLLGVGLLLAAQAPAQSLGALSVGSYTSNANSLLTGPYAAGPMPVLQVYRNTTAVLQDSLAFTVQAFGPGYSQGLTQFYGRLKGVGPNGAQDTYALGDLDLPGPGSYLVQTSVFSYDRQAKKWNSGPTRTYWLFPVLPTPPPPPAPLPVELVSFTATMATDSVALRWQTASERNSAGFWVERSSDGVSFARRRYLASQGNSASPHSYQVRDAAPPARAYYRLRQVDVDGTELFSPVVSVAPLRLVVTAYPNPATEFTTVRGAAGSMARLYDGAGRLRREQLLDAEGRLDLRGLPLGSYLLVVGDGGSVHRTRLVVF